MSKRFRIAFSFAGEKRAFVAKVARLLADRLGEEHILYDKYHEAEFARSDLARHLPRLYHEQTDLVVAVLCSEYEGKEWCGLEWNAIYGRLKKGQVQEVMLARFDQVSVAELFGLAGFVELDDKTDDQAARLILERLARNEGRPRDHYTKDNLAPTGGVDWPEVAPELQWPVADHRVARQAFAELVTRRAAFRVLPIHGLSETGKTHLTKQFQRNALRISDLRCGRFDFKGSADMGNELRSFAEQLEVPVPSPDWPVAKGLSSIITSLRDVARPTLLILDTFEAAGDAARWVNDSLLLGCARAAWLRIIIVGQRRLQPGGEPWADCCAPPVELRLPTAQEWFEYGQPHRPGLTLDFVSQALAYGAKSSVLAGLLGPGD